MKRRVGLLTDIFVLTRLPAATALSGSGMLQSEHGEEMLVKMARSLPSEIVSEIVPVNLYIYVYQEHDRVEQGLCKALTESLPL